MKIARVAITEEFGPIGRIIDVQAEPVGVRAGAIAEVEVADDFDAAIMTGVIAEDGSITFVVDLAKNAAKIVAAKTAEIGVKYVEMDTAIFNQMEVVFGTRRADSAAATEGTLDLMKNKPELFAAEELTADIPVTGFASGAALDTEAKVVDYATKRIAQIEAYGVFRAKRIKQFRDEKAAILA